MTVWLAFGLMTLAAMFAVLWPLGRTRHAHAVTDADVYRAQLGEVERARALGTLAAGEAESVRTEIARRLIAASGRVQAEASASLGRRRAVAIMALVAVPLVAASVYAVTGSPHLPGQPLGARATPAAGEPPFMLIARVEAALQRNPEDGRGWDIIAPVYLRMGRAQDAAVAYASAIRLSGASAERESGHGEALTMAAGGAVTEDARAAFERALVLEAGNPRARFYLARARAQDGDRAGARADLEAFLAESPMDAPWRPLVEQALSGLGDAP